jgi:N-glycosylase/DNA lyase
LLLQAEVIPVDTHVLQIATKHYGFRGLSGTKQTMSPKLYEVRSDKFHGVWGNHAGRAHSVSFLSHSRSATHALPAGIIHCRSQGILRLWSRHSLLSPKKQDRPIHRAAADPSSAAVRSARKRNANRVQSQDAIPKLREGMCADHDGPAEASSLAERVKKRRRVSQAPR